MGSWGRPASDAEIISGLRLGAEIDLSKNGAGLVPALCLCGNQHANSTAHLLCCKKHLARHRRIHDGIVNDVAWHLRRHGMGAWVEPAGLLGPGKHRADIAVRRAALGHLLLDVCVVNRTTLKQAIANKIAKYAQRMSRPDSLGFIAINGRGGTCPETNKCINTLAAEIAMWTTMPHGIAVVELAAAIAYRVGPVYGHCAQGWRSGERGAGIQAAGDVPPTGTSRTSGIGSSRPSSRDTR